MLVEDDKIDKLNFKSCDDQKIEAKYELNLICMVNSCS